MYIQSLFRRARSRQYHKSRRGCMKISDLIKEIRKRTTKSRKADGRLQLPTHPRDQGRVPATALAQHNPGQGPPYRATHRATRTEHTDVSKTDVHTQHCRITCGKRPEDSGHVGKITKSTRGAETHKPTTPHNLEYRKVSATGAGRQTRHACFSALPKNKYIP